MSRRIRLVGLSFIGLVLAMALSLVAFGGAASAQTCDTSGTKDGSASPTSVQPNQAIGFTATGFNANEEVSFWFTSPSGIVAGTARPLCCAGPDGVVRFAPEPLPAEIYLNTGKWALTVEGSQSGHQSIIYFCVSNAAAPPPAQQTCDPAGSKDGTASPTSVQPNQAIGFTATGFTANEEVSFWFTAPTGDVAGTARPLCCAGPDGVVRFAPEPLPAEIYLLQGKWALTVEGSQSKHQSVIYFCVSTSAAPPPAAQPTPPPAAQPTPTAAPQATAPPAAPPAAQPTAPPAAPPTDTSGTANPTQESPPTESIGMPRSGQGDSSAMLLIVTSLFGFTLLATGWLVRRASSLC